MIKNKVVTESMNNIIVYRNKILQYSETFIYNQSVKLSKYTAYFLGAKASNDSLISMPDGRVLIINNGKPAGIIQESFFKLFGWLPFGLNQQIKYLNPLLLHAHFGQDGAIVLPWVESLKIPFIVSFHGSDATLTDDNMNLHGISGKFYLQRRIQLAKKVDKVIVPSNFLRQKVIQQGFMEDKIEIINHGVDLKKFSPSGKAPKFGNILFIGRLIPRKGLDYLINAIKLVRNEFQEVYLTIIGDGLERENFELLAKKELGNGFCFLGAKSHNDVKCYLEDAYIFVMPSITMASGEAETFGLVFIESFAMGVPVVCFNSGATSEVVTDGETGFLVDEGDTLGLARSIISLLRNNLLRDQMGKAARKKVEEKFNLHIQNSKLEKIYDDVLNIKK